MRGCIVTAALLVILTPPGSTAWAKGTCGKGGVRASGLKVDFEGAYYRLFTPPSYDEAKPWPLLLALHGDEGNPESGIVPLWKPAWQSDGTFILLTPKAPYADGSWWRDSRHAAWLDKLLAKMFAEYNVDIDRIWAWGGSGGSCLLGAYALVRQNLFAAVHYNQCACGGSYKAPPTSGCKIPARYSVSTGDFCREGAVSHHKMLTAKGHETEWIDAPCTGHCVSVKVGVTEGLPWLKKHTRCGAVTGDGCGMPGDLPGAPPPPDAGGLDGGGPGGSGGAADDGDAAPGGGGAGGGSGDVPVPDSGSGDRQSPGADAVGGCACNAAEAGGGSLPTLAAAWIVWMGTRRPRQGGLRSSRKGR